MNRFFLVLMFLAVAVTAKTQYVTDSFEITLRSTASNKSKVLWMPKSGTPLTIIGGDGQWLNVRIKGTSKKGWVLKRYVMNRVPYENQTAYLTKVNDEMKESISPLKAEIEKLKTEKRKLETELKSTKKKLNSSKKKYSNLYDGSSDFLGLQADFDSATVTLKKQTTTIEELEATKTSLLENVRNRWFLTGALVVLISYLLGRSARKEKRKRSF